MKHHFILRTLSLSLCLILLTTTLLSCTNNVEKEYYDAYFTAMDTQITVRLARDSGQKDGRKNIYHEDSFLESIITECANIATQTEGVFSRTDENSLTYEINSQADSFFEVDSEFCELLNRSYDISAKTNGAFDITIGAVTELWNVTGDEPSVPSEESISEALLHTGKDKILLDGNSITKTDREAKLDFGAIAKGYALSKIIDYLKDTDVLYGLVSFGGNVAVFGTKYDSKDQIIKYKVGITDPTDTTKVVGYVYIENGYVSVSGDYERYFEADSVRYHHIMDPATARPAESDISSVSVICNNGSLADALSTALFVMGSEKALEYYESGIYDFEAVITLHDGTTIVTDGLNENGAFEKYIEPTEEEK